ncbi:MAG TPA: S41 family peptidase [Bryobacteraceae bacterium]|nr:S41 family peptidase [Bryobacteraceae bacterium]
MNSRFKVLLVSFSTVLVALLLLGAAMGKSGSPEEAYRHLAVYTEVLSRIKSEYVEEPDIKGVTLGAMNGMLEAIDPFASYLNADQYKQYLKAQDQKRATVGLIMSKRYGYIGVVDALPGSSAAKAGLSTGDLIESIGGVATRDMPLAYAEMLLNGEPGSSVELSVLRLRKPEPQKVTLTRANTALPGVASKMLEGQIGYVHVQSMEQGRLKDVTNAVTALQKQGAQKLILDLRNNAVGKPEDGAALANLFVDKGTLTYLQGQKVQRVSYEASPEKVISKLPVVVLINRGTANAAEVAASALLDAKRGELVGERSYGDASLRRAVTMDDGGAVILSVAKYYNAGGKAIQDTGVTPTILVSEIEQVDDDNDENTPAPTPKGEDPILKRGIELLKNGKSAAKTALPGNAGGQQGLQPPASPILTPQVEKDKKQ